MCWSGRSHISRLWWQIMKTSYAMYSSNPSDICRFLSAFRRGQYSRYSQRRHPVQAVLLPIMCFTLKRQTRLRQNLWNLKPDWEYNENENSPAWPGSPRGSVCCVDLLPQPFWSPLAVVWSIRVQSAQMGSSTAHNLICCPMWALVGKKKKIIRSDTTT